METSGYAIPVRKSSTDDYAVLSSDVKKQVEGRSRRESAALSKPGSRQDLYDHLNSSSRKSSTSEQKTKRRSAQDPLPSIRGRRSSAAPALLDVPDATGRVGRISSVSSDGGYNDIVPDTLDSLCEEDWCHGTISRNEAENRIRAHAIARLNLCKTLDGIFLVRAKRSEISGVEYNYALSLAFKDENTGRMMVEHHITEQARRKDGTPGSHFFVDGKIKIPNVRSVRQLVETLMSEEHASHSEAVCGRAGPMLRILCPKP